MNAPVHSNTMSTFIDFHGKRAGSLSRNSLSRWSPIFKYPSAVASTGFSYRP